MYYVFLDQCKRFTICNIIVYARRRTSNLQEKLEIPNYGKLQKQHYGKLQKVLLFFYDNG